MNLRLYKIYPIIFTYCNTDLTIKAIPYVCDSRGIPASEKALIATCPPFVRLPKHLLCLSPTEPLYLAEAVLCEYSYGPPSSLALILGWFVSCWVFF